MTTDTAEQKFNKEGLVFEYNGRPYPPTHRLGFFGEDLNLTESKASNWLKETHDLTEAELEELCD